MEFPDSMTMAQVNTEANRLFNEGPGQDQPQSAQPTDADPPSLEPNPNAGPVRGESPYKEIARRIGVPLSQGISGALGVGEMALSMGTGLVGQAAGGLKGILDAPQGADKAADSVESVSRFLTYSPKSRAGQAIATGIATPIEKYDTVVKDVAEYIGGGDPAQAALAYTIMNAPFAEIGAVGAPGRVSRTLMARNAAAAAERVWLEQGIQLGSRKMADQIARAAQAQNPDVPNQRGAGIEQLPDDVRLASKIAKDDIDSAYTRARAGSTYVNLQGAENLLNTINGILMDYNPPNSSFNILDTDKNLRANYDQIRSWAIQQRKAQTAGDVAGAPNAPTPKEAPGTSIMPVGPRSGSADAIPMSDWDVARQPGPNLGQNRLTRPVPNHTLWQRGSRQHLSEPERNTLPATQGGRDVVPAGARTTEETITGRDPRTGRELPGTNALVHLNEVDRVRRTLKAMLPENRKNWSPQDKLRMQMKGALDAFIENQFNTGLISGTDADIAAWKRARGLVQEYRENFKVNRNLYNLVTDIDANPEDFRKYIFGLAQMGAKTESAQVVQKLKSIFGENSPQMNAIRMEFLMNALEPLRGPKPDINKFVTYVENINKNNPTLVKELSPWAASGLDELVRISKAAVNAGDPASVQLSVPKMLARLTVGHQIARKGALVGASAAIMEALFGRSPRAVRKDMLSELVGLPINEPIFKPNTAELQGLWAAALNEAMTREFEEEE